LLDGASHPSRRCIREFKGYRQSLRVRVWWNDASEALMFRRRSRNGHRESEVTIFSDAFSHLLESGRKATTVLYAPNVFPYFERPSRRVNLENVIRFQGNVEPHLKQLLKTGSRLEKIAISYLEEQFESGAVDFSEVDQLPLEIRMRFFLEFRNLFRLRTIEKLKQILGQSL
jgi:hypothetical protein